MSDILTVEFNSLPESVRNRFVAITKGAAGPAPLVAQKTSSKSKVVSCGTQCGSREIWNGAGTWCKRPSCGFAASRRSPRVIVCRSGFLRSAGDWPSMFAERRRG